MTREYRKQLCLDARTMDATSRVKRGSFGSVGISAAIERVECRASGAASRAASAAATCEATNTVRYSEPCIWLHKHLRDLPSCVHGRGIYLTQPICK